jgi:hypothetical protein
MYVVDILSETLFPDKYNGRLKIAGGRIYQLNMFNFAA